MTPGAMPRMALGLLVLVLAGFWVFWVLLGPRVAHGHPAPIEVTVAPGESADAVAAELARSGVVRSRLGFWLLLHVVGGGRRIESGTYLLSPSLTPLEILRRLTAGRVAVVRIVVPEGFTVRQVAVRLWHRAHIPIAAFLAVARRGVAGIRRRPGERYALEGYLGPRTYELPLGASAAAAARMMVGGFRELFGSRLRQRAHQLHLSVNQVVTLASIIEHETRIASQRPLVSAVFWNRLKRGMPLDSDATVLYALGGGAHRLAPGQTAVPSPYNTYRIRGLPPGPIDSPGLGSLKAALFPAHVNYLYFVSTRSGRDIFSRTYAGQLRVEARLGIR